MDDLIDASVAMAGLLHLNLTAIDVASAVRAAADSIRPAARVRNVAVECRMRSDLGTILADAARIHQILLNLLSNAVKFTPAGGRVALDAVRESDAVTICVSDNGIGIAPEFLPFVFDRFRQADTSTTRTHGGIGLGLAIVKQLVGMMKGEVSVKSEGVGKGASFAVRFPAHGLDRHPT